MLEEYLYAMVKRSVFRQINICAVSEKRVVVSIARMMLNPSTLWQVSTGYSMFFHCWTWQL